MELTSSIIDVENVSEQTRHAMFALFERYYQAVDPHQFECDLSKKSRVVILRNRDEQICGFSTLEISCHVWQGRSLRSVFSGDTLIDRRYWGSQALAFPWLREIGRIRAQQPGQELYWLLTVKGHRTFRYLSAFSQAFVPNWRGVQPSGLNALKDYLAASRFGDAYDPRTGIVRSPDARGYLASAWIEPTARERKRDDVRFFLERNPGYVRGDELVCLCSLGEENMKPLTMRLSQQGLDG